MTNSTARRRQTPKLPKHVAPPPGPRVINAAPSLEKAEMYGVDDDRPVFSRAMALAGRIFVETIPQWLTVGAMLGLIFGGCCSNVFALEAIIQVEPASGMLLTFVQFLFVAITGYISQLDRDHPPLFLRPNKVPLRRWMINIILFFTINVLNNHAFSYNISVPVHIILRSGGSITTMIAGFLYGKRYSRIQILAVLLLTIGVVTAAWTDAQDKAFGGGGNSAKNLESLDNLDGSDSPGSSENPGGSDGSGSSGDAAATDHGVRFLTGLAILFIAQVMSAIMGLYTEETYRKYGPQWRENLFYSHLLSLPLFLPFLPSLINQFTRLANSAPLTLPWGDTLDSAPVAAGLRKSVERVQVPSQLVFLVLNVLTQYACIRGVNLLAAASSALTVTIVLNIRKLVSLLLSIWLFGNRLAPGTMAGAAVVFFAGGLYSLDGRRKPTIRARGVKGG